MKKKYITVAIIFAVLLTIDLVTKSIFVDINKVLIPNVINLVYTPNHGAAFNFFDGYKWLLIAASFALIIFLIIFDIKTKKNHMLYTVSFALIITGGVGNLIDRLALGYVRDFIQFGFWTRFPVFNVADICLTIGVIMMIVYVFFFDKSEAKK